jgi:hypothetical protein
VTTLAVQHCRRCDIDWSLIAGPRSYTCLFCASPLTLRSSNQDAVLVHDFLQHLLLDRDLSPNTVD